MDADVTSTELPGCAANLLILCNNRGGADLSIRATEWNSVSGKAVFSLGSIAYSLPEVLQAAVDGWVEITKEERAGVVCRPSELGYEWLAHYRARQLLKGRARL